MKEWHKGSIYACAAAKFLPSLTLVIEAGNDVALAVVLSAVSGSDSRSKPGTEMSGKVQPG